MRILRLDFGADIGSADLHPFISVIHGMDEGRNSRLISAIRSLVSGSGRGAEGLVENGGHLVEVNSANIGELGPYSTEDVVLNVDRLAGGPEVLPGLRAELDQVQMVARIDSVWVEEVRADLVPAAAARVQNLRDRIDGKASALLDENTRARLERVRTTLTKVDGTPPTVAEIPKDVEVLLDRWDRYQRAEAGSHDHLDALSRRVQDAEAALTDALRFLADAENDAQPILLSTADEDRLEELAHSKVEGRSFFGRGKSDEDEEELKAILAKVDQPNYSAYAMYRLSPEPPAEKVAIVHQAKAQVESAQTEVEIAREELGKDQSAVQLSATLEEIKTDARNLLGPMLPSDLGAALRASYAETPNPVWMDASRDLYDAMVEVGIEIPDDLAPDQLPIWADDWLVKQEQDAAAAGKVDPGALASELEAAENALDRHARAMARIDRLETKAAASRSKVNQLQRRIDRIEQGTMSTSDAVHEAIVELSQRVRGTTVSSIPVIVRGNFDGIDDRELGDLFDRVESLAQSVQLVVVTDRNAAAEWARNAGLRRALCAGANS